MGKFLNIPKLAVPFLHQEETKESNQRIPKRVLDKKKLKKRMAKKSRRTNR